MRNQVFGVRLINISLDIKTMRKGKKHKLKYFSLDGTGKIKKNGICSRGIKIVRIYEWTPQKYMLKAWCRIKNIQHAFYTRVGWKFIGWPRYSHGLSPNEGLFFNRVLFAVLTLLFQLVLRWLEVNGKKNIWTVDKTSSYELFTLWIFQASLLDSLPFLSLSLSLSLFIYIYIYIKEKGAHGVMVIVVGNGHGDASSNPVRDWLHFT